MDDGSRVYTYDALNRVTSVVDNLSPMALNDPLMVTQPENEAFNEGGLTVTDAVYGTGSEATSVTRLWDKFPV
ncbi:hypothetical protein ACFQZE_19000 [Paenibacillus sp. GCM10027627]|uniref:hypothetical protein n=1 Tax=unclassified Paenibacillus TaxID=185978 RepID=UPI003627520A